MASGIGHNAFAQILSFDTLGDYSKSVQFRLHDVGASVNLTVEEQISLANLFEAEESELLDGVRNAKSSVWVDSVRVGYQNTFNALLASSKRDSFYQSKISERTEVMSALTTQMLKRKYNTDDAMEQHFATIYKWRDFLIEKIWLTTTDKDIRNENLLHALTVYDTLISRWQQV